MKKFLWMAMTALLLFSIVLLGCSAEPASTNPKAGSDGFYTPDQVYKGGKESKTGLINIKEITTSKQADSTVIEIKLLYGSRESGKDEARINNIPEFEVSCLPLPERLVVKIKDIGHWDYQYQESEWAGLVLGVMNRQSIAGFGTETASGDDYYTLYFSLSAEASYKVEETAESIKITLKETGRAAKKGYFAVVNAYSEYVNGDIPGDLGFAPTLCSDKRTPILISKMFATEEEARKFRDETQEKLENRIISIVELSSGQLPEYSTEISETDLAGVKIIKKDGVSYPLDLLLSNGYYLCTSNDGDILFYRSYTADEAISEEEAGEIGEIDESPLIQRLWIKDRQGAEQQLETSDFTSLYHKAQFSSDGRYIAVLDVANESSILYVYDTETKETYNMGEEGLGTITDDFVWDSGRNVLYSISGNGESKQLMVSDFTKEDPTPEALEEQGIESASLGFADGKLYLVDYNENTEIFSFDIATGMRKKIVDGIEFTLSSDGKYMAYLAPSEPEAGAEEEMPDERADFILLNLATMEKKTIVKNAVLLSEGYGFTADNSRLYFINASEDVEGMNDVFTQPVYYYDMATGETKLDFLTPVESLSMSGESGKLYLNSFIQSESGVGLDVTYIYDYNKNYAAQ